MQKPCQTPPREYFLELEHYRIAVLEFGPPDGPAILALHGWLDNAESFSFIAEGLSKHRLIAVDLVGHGLSSHRHAAMPYHIWDNVTDVQNILSALALERVHLLGHSMGASIAMLYASVFPEKVGQLMAIDGLVPLHCPVSDTAAQLNQALLKHSRLGKRQGSVYSEHEQTVKARMNGRWPVPYEAAKRLMKRGVKRHEGKLTWSHDPRLLLPSLVRFCPEQIRDFLNNVKAPCTVVKAQAGVAELIDGWVDELSNSTLIEIPGGHHAHMEAVGAATIVEIIETWD